MFAGVESSSLSPKSFDASYISATLLIVPVFSFVIFLVNINVTSFVSSGFINVFARLALYAFLDSPMYQSWFNSALNVMSLGI